MKRFGITLVMVVMSICASAQSFREQFTEANLLFEDGFYSLSIKIYEKLIAENEGNANLHYKAGRAYLEMGVNKDKALPHLVLAAKNIKKTYDPYSSSFKSAPVEALFYLAHAYHLKTELDSADKYFNLFLDQASNKHYLRPQADRQKEMVAVARELIQDPLNVVITNMGRPINTEYAEYSPIVAFDENSIFFTSRRRRSDFSNQADIDITTGLHFEDIYVSNRSLKGEWLEPELLNINVPDQHSSVVSMSTDGLTLHLYKTYHADGNIYISELDVASGWSPPSMVGSDVNSEFNEYYANLSYNGRVLYFVSDREGGYGGKDIYYVQRLPNGEWGKSINAGPVLNTQYDEDVPFFHPDDRTMYFASNGHRSMGGYDIFFSQMDEDSVWSIPRNVGYPINSTDDDHSYIATPNGLKGYYASKAGDAIGMSDIFMVEYKEDAEKIPELDLSSFAVIKGWVIAPGGEIPNDFRINMKNAATGEDISEAKPVSRNGSFVFIVPSEASYHIDYINGDDTLLREDLDIPKGVKYQELSREVFLYPKGDKLGAIAIKDEVLGSVVRWKLTFEDPDQLIPLGSKVLYMGEDGTVIDTAYVTKDGFFEYRRLDGDEKYILKPLVMGYDNSELSISLHDDRKNTEPIEPIELVHSEELFMEPSLVQLAEADREKLKAPITQKAESLADDSRNEQVIDNSQDNTAESPSPIELPSRAKAAAPENTYRFTLDYNATTSSSFEETMNDLIGRIKQEIQENDSVSLYFESSASTVPTSLPGGNFELSKNRLISGKAAFYESLEGTGIDINKILTTGEKSLVSGPDYYTNANTPKSVFVDYQYFKVIIN